MAERKSDTAFLVQALNDIRDGGRRASTEDARGLLDDMDIHVQRPQAGGQFQTEKARTNDHGIS